MPLVARRGVAVGRSSRWEEDHVVVMTERHKLQALEPDHRAEAKWSCHLKLVRNGGHDAQTNPYLTRQLSVFGPAALIPTSG
jgi:hypothetical protein